MKKDKKENIFLFILCILILRLKEEYNCFLEEFIVLEGRILKTLIISVVRKGSSKVFEILRGK